MFCNYEQAKARIQHAEKIRTGNNNKDSSRFNRHQQYDKLAAGADRDPSFFIF